MKDLTPRKGDLEPIETASRDEIAALQLTRLKWSLAHAYEYRPHQTLCDSAPRFHR
ncbi:MAG: phenylacetate--CoA ligase, partial [Pseudomonadota bacterium]